MVVKPIINLATKYTDDIVGIGVRNSKKITNYECLKLIPQSLEDFSTKIVKTRTPKEIVSESIGDNCKISKDWQDLGTFYGIKSFFTKPNQHYVYSKQITPEIFERGHISCYYNKEQLLEKFFVFDWKTKSIRKFNANGRLITSYTPEETLAIMRYKSDSSNIHKILRQGKAVKNEAQVKESIEALSNIFKTGKTSRTREAVVGYRALDNVSYKKIMSMPDDGMIFTDQSFMSIATDKKSAAKFLNMKNKNHLMQITIPEGTQYLQMDELGHIINPQKPENEWVLNACTNLRIKNRDGMIIAEIVK